MNKKVLFKGLPFLRSFGIRPLNFIVGIAYFILDGYDVYHGFKDLTGGNRRYIHSGKARRSRKV